MTANDGIRNDLAYVASAVRNECPPEIRGIYVLWAVLVPVGFALPDFAASWTGWYWLVAGPAGGVASWLIGARSADSMGMRDRRTGLRYGWHWGIAGLAFLLAALPAWTGAVSPKVMGANMLLIAGLVYLLAGVHLNRPMAFAGAIMFAGYILLHTTGIAYVWTTTGLVIGAALLVTAIFAGRGRA